MVDDVDAVGIAAAAQRRDHVDDLDLRRHVVGGVLLLEHRERRELRIAQVLFQVGVARAAGQRHLGDRDVALTQLDMAFKIDPGSIEVLKDLGVLALLGQDLGPGPRGLGDLPALVLAELDIVDDGAQRAASSRLCSVSGSTGRFSAKARSPSIASAAPRVLALASAQVTPRS